MSFRKETVRDAEAALEFVVVHAHTENTAAGTAKKRVFIRFRTASNPVKARVAASSANLLCRRLDGATSILKVRLNAPLRYGAELRWIDLDPRFAPVGTRKNQKSLLALCYQLAKFDCRTGIALNDHKCFRTMCAHAALEQPGLPALGSVTGSVLSFCSLPPSSSRPGLSLNSKLHQSWGSTHRAMVASTSRR